MSQFLKSVTTTNSELAKIVDKDPFTWTDFPKDIDGSRKIKDAYKDALGIKNGYKLLQLAKIEFENVYTYGNLVPGKMLHEAYTISLENKDPFLAYYILVYDFEHNLFTLVNPREMIAKIYNIGLERKEAGLLHRLADYLDSHRDFYELKEIGGLPKEMHQKALFINNKDYRPYPNLYDSPENEKPLDRYPITWKDFPTDISSPSEMSVAYAYAEKENNGYRIIQLAQVQQDKQLLTKTSSLDMIKKALTIAQYNKDPYLVLYVVVFAKKNNIFTEADLAKFALDVYDISIARRDSSPLYLLYYYEKMYDFIPDLKPREIMLKASEIGNLYKEKKLVGIDYI